METSRICIEGKNCWRIAPANRATFLIDGDAYYSALASALERAQRFILIAAWQLDSRFRLCPADEQCLSFGNFLHRLVQRNRKLHIYLLVWDFAMVFAADREILPLYSHPWRTHKRIHFLLDSDHPLGASLHEKIVVVDDAVAFAGGLDIADRRWDTPSHAAEGARRIDAYNRPYPPYPDVQLMADGGAAAALGDLVKERWYRTTGGRIRTPSGRVGDLWVIGGYIVGSLVLAPITLLVIATAAAFGPLTGFLYALCGSWVSAMVTYGLGRLVGKEIVHRFTGSVLSRVRRQISRHGFLSMLFARIVPIAPFAVVNVVAGACQVRLRDFSLATALGMIPGITIIVVLGHQLGRTLRDPTFGTVALLLGLAIFFASLGVIFYRWYAQRRSMARLNLNLRPTNGPNDAHGSFI